MARRLFEHIWDEHLSPLQKELQPIGRDGLPVPVHTLKREPKRLQDIKVYQKTRIAIWRDNETMLVVRNCLLTDQPFAPTLAKNAAFTIMNAGICGHRGNVNVWFWSLPQPKDKITTLEIGKYGKYEEYTEHAFDLTALQPEQLQRILDANPTRKYELYTGEWTPAQSAVLATRPFPLHMTFFGQFELQDEGTAFVDALQQRTSPFGSLQFYGSPFGDQNLERLLQLENTFERLSPLGIDPKFNRLALSAKVNALDYKFCVKDFQPNDFDSLVISTKDLSVDLYIGKGDPWKEILIAFLNRLSILGHMEKFNLRTSCSDFGFNPKECVVPVVDALIRAVTANQKLSCLNLSSAYWVEEHLPNIVKALEDHEGIRHLFVFNYPVEKDSRGRTSCPSLTRLLERNPNIRVLDSCGNLITDGSNKMLLMYFRNFFYQDSLDFRKESNTVRPFLVASTLMGFASAQFPLIATLLSHHTDLLCDFMKGPSPDVAGGNNVTVARTSPQSTSHSKRKRTKQAPRATKKHTTLAGDA